jgi:hypothetical protein
LRRRDQPIAAGSISSRCREAILPSLCVERFTWPLRPLPIERTMRWIVISGPGPHSRNTRGHRNARQPVVQGRSFLGVAYYPDVLDPVAGDIEREHRHGDAVLLRDQAGLAVDRTLAERASDPGSNASACTAPCRCRSSPETESWER